MAGAARQMLWPAVCAVTALVTAVRCNQPPSLCELHCCLMLPNCTHAVVVSCRCPHSEINIGRNSIPKSVLFVSISDASDVTIDTNATRDLPSLKSLSLDDIGIVRIKKEALKLPAGQNAFRLMRMHFVKTLRMEASAFSGYWSPNATVLFNFIDLVIVYPKAFTFTTSDPGPSLEIRHVETLTLEPDSFAAKFSHLSVVNVTVPSCSPNSFGGVIHHLELTRVRIDAAEGRCVNGAGSWAKLTLRSADLRNVQPSSVSGNIQEVFVDSSNITTLHQSGFQLITASLKVNSSSFQTMEPNGLNVSASESILLENVTVGLLRQNALKGLRLDTSPGAAISSLTIRQLRVIDAESGSLAFAAAAPVRLDGLDLAINCSCPLDCWARQLTGTATTDRTLQPQLEVLRQLSLQCHCPPGTAPDRERAPTAAESGAPATEEPASRGSGGESRAPLHIAVGVLAVLAVASAAAAVVFWRRSAGPAPPHGRRASADGNERPGPATGDGKAAGDEDELTDDDGYEVIELGRPPPSLPGGAERPQLTDHLQENALYASCAEVAPLVAVKSSPPRSENGGGAD